MIAELENRMVVDSSWGRLWLPPEEEEPIDVEVTEVHQEQQEQQRAQEPVEEQYEQQSFGNVADALFGNK